MTLEIKVPALPESVADATVARWYKKAGDAVKRDENLVDIETDKVVLEVVAQSDGILNDILKPEGATVLAEEVIGHMESGSSTQPASSASAPAAPAAAIPSPGMIQNITLTPTPAKYETLSSLSSSSLSPAAKATETEAGPAARRMLQENEMAPDAVTGTGKGGRITTEDVTRVITEAPKALAANLGIQRETVQNPKTTTPVSMGTNAAARAEERVPMSRLRSRIAERLLQSQQTTATLTTFNEINLGPVMALRAQYKDLFEKKHGVRLGMMSFFVKATVAALKRFPVVNASVDGNDIMYHGYFDIGVAVSSPRGLVVPILRDVDQMSLADIEKQIATFGQKAKDGTLSIEEMTGGTFTISNGGVFGSLLSTPILNPPQSGILGMHKIEDRPVVEKGEIVIRPMMYVAMSYDHRLIDGSESVRFLVAIKEMVEDPARLLLDV